MDKEIIIDGVDVAGCSFSELLYGAVCCNKSGLHGACNNNPECEYKQLKRLEQENAELKAENEKLKEEIRIISETRKVYEENLKLCKWQEQQINRLATAIQKIDKILKVYFDDDNKATREMEQVVEQFIKEQTNEK